MSSEGRVAIIVAIIGLAGTLGTAVIGNYYRNSQTSETKPAASDVPVEPKKQDTDAKPDNLPSLLTRAEKLTADWFSAAKQQDINHLVSLTTPPFYFKQEVWLSADDIRAGYARTLSDPLNQQMTIRELKANLVSEWKKSGVAQSDDPAVRKLFSSKRIDDNDIAVTVIFDVPGMGRDGLALFFRRTNGGLEMAGIM